MWNAAPIRFRGHSALVFSVVILSLTAISAATATASARVRSTAARSTAKHTRARRTTVVRHHVWHHRKRVRQRPSTCGLAGHPTAADSARIATAGHEALATLKAASPACDRGCAAGVDSSKPAGTRPSQAQLPAQGIAHRASCPTQPAGASEPAQPSGGDSGPSSPGDSLSPTGGEPSQPSEGGSPSSGPGNPSCPTDDAVPAPIACQGYHEVFRDDFTTLNRKVWDDHIWYDDPPEESWSGFQEADADGILHLRSSSNFTWHHGDNSGTWPINTISTHDSGLAFTRGYFEVRMKYSYAGDAAWPAFWLLGERGANNDANYPNINPYCAQNALPAAQCYNAELDVLDNGGFPNEDYFVLHRNTSSLYGAEDETNDSAWRTLDDRPGDAWHTYSALWTTDRVTWYRDGQQVASTPTYDSTDQPMFLLLQNWIGAPDRWGPDITGTDSDVQVDYVTVWQK